MFFSSEGARLFYQTVGSGPDLVLLHPTPLDHSFWLPLAVELSSQYRVTLSDLRGHGQSGAGQAGISIEILGRDVERLLEAAGIQNALFAGCSIGSYVLYEIWRRIPQRVQALAFTCGKPQPDSAAIRSKRQQNIETIKVDGVAGFFDQAMETLVAPGFRQREPGKAAELRAMMNAMDAEAVIAVQQGLMGRPDSVPTLKTISQPVLALAAAQDRASTPEEMKAIADLAPDVEYHVLPDAGHFAPYEQPEAVALILKKFFERAPR